MMNQPSQYPYDSHPNDPGATPSNPYPPYQPGGSSPADAYPAYDPNNEATLRGSRSTPVFNPYTSTPSIPPPPPSRARRLSTSTLVLIGLALLVVVAASIFGIVGLSQHAQINNLQATATAVAHTQATAQAYTQATATTIASHYPFSDKLVLDDPMYDNSHGNRWAEGADSTGGNCQFTEGAYHVSQTQAGYFYYCLAQSRTFSNFTYEVKMSIIKGDFGGIIFRADSADSEFYYLFIGQDGSYFLLLNKGSKNIQALAAGHITQTISSGFHTGPNEANLIGVVARGNMLDLYANGQHFASATDSTLASGEIGVIVDALKQPTEVAFSDASIWVL